jgi:hypothetical protein
MGRDLNHTDCVQSGSAGRTAVPFISRLLMLDVRAYECASVESVDGLLGDLEMRMPGIFPKLLSQ